MHTPATNIMLLTNATSVQKVNKIKKKAAFKAAKIETF